MRTARWNAILLVVGISLSIVGCGSGTATSNGDNHPPTITYTLTVNSTNPATGVAITVSPADNNSATNGTTSFTRTYNTGTSVTLTAPATSGSDTFSSWTGCTSTSAAACTVTMSANTTVTANYAAPSSTAYTLTVNSTDPATGVAITASPADNNSLTGGTTSFTLSYNSGTAVMLTAPATSGGNTFTSWTGCTSATTVTCNVTLNANTTVTANYTTPAPPPTTTYTLTVNSTNPASGVAIGVSGANTGALTTGTTSFTLTSSAGTALVLTAPATAGGDTFASWTGCTSVSTTTCNVTLNANTTVAANYTAPTSSTYTLTVESTNPTSGVSITASPADNNGKTTEATSFNLTYNAGTSVTLTAPATEEGAAFSSWTGCTSSTDTCTLTLSSNTVVSANYAAPAITSVTVTPNPSTVTIGTTQQFTATVVGTGTDSTSTGVTWTVTAPAGSTDSAGTITAGLYTTPYPAPATVTVTATSTQDTTKSASVTVTLAAPATAAGPSLTVNATPPSPAVPISPMIYGMNAYQLDTTTATNANITGARFGGDDTSRYNYQTNVVNSADDYYFENFTGSSAMLGGGLFNGFVTTANTLGIKTIATAPMIGWVSNSTVDACSFTEAAYPGQQEYIAGVSGTSCGNGIESNGTDLTGDSPGNPTTTPTLTSIAEPAPTAPGTAAAATTTWADGTWIGGWVNCLLSSGSYCAATGGKDVTIWDMDNEPEYWSAVHRDVHPNPMTYDEITNDGIGSALAIKTVDPNALVSGPVISGWYNYFYSEEDVDDGYAQGPCYAPWSNPLDRMAHNGVPLIEYYMQQMKLASQTYGKRLLDYVDVHAYFAADYPTGSYTSTGLTTAGNTAEQQARMNSTRVLWDSTYTDPTGTDLYQPNYEPSDPSNCTVPLQAPQLIRMMQTWVANDYPGTMTSIDEYNFGGNESINGAVTQADVLGIFGKYGLDMAMLWPTAAFDTQGPGNEAFAIYRNYDGNNSTFGDSSLTSTSANQGTLSVYGGVRSSDNAITVVVINKTYGPLTSTLSIENFTPTSGETVTPYLYSNANLTAIVPQTPVAITPPTSGAISTINAYSFPAQSITLFVIPN